ncbi:MAG: hypothetical protein CFE43_17215 [Burkholderiales bacterium PBB3]|nr:MAG: hypothetical protein CFE43_17215 [Burkholderiales bacterium PBB3]
MHMRAILATLVLAVWGAAQAGGPPLARVEPVQDIYFGDTVSDPYRWMERGGPEFETWMHAQDDVTRSEFAAMPGRASLLKEVSASGEGIALMNGLVRVGSQFYYLKRTAGAERPALYMRRVGSATEALLVDPATIDGGGENSAIDYAVPSPNGRYIAFGLSRGGSESSVLRVFDVAQRRVLAEAIDRCRFGSPEWLPSSTEFFYTRTRALPPSSPRDQEFKDMSIWHHRLGDEPTGDREIFDVATHDSALGHDAFPYLTLASGGQYAFVQLNSGVSDDGPWYITTRSELDKPRPAWRKLADANTRLQQYSAALNAPQRPIVRGDTAYFVSFQDAPRGRMVKVDLRAGHENQVTPAMPQGEDALLGMAEARDGVYLARLSGSTYRVQRWSPGTGHVDPVTLPKDVAVSELVTNRNSAGVTLSLSSWIAPADYVRSGVGVPQRSWRLGNSSAPPGVALVAETLDITARDGVKVPVTIVRRVGARPAGPAASLRRSLRGLRNFYRPTLPIPPTALAKARPPVCGGACPWRWRVR